MAKKVGDICVKVGSYQAPDGTTKNRYENVGNKFENNDGGHFYTIKRTFNPAGVPNADNKDSVILSIFDKKDEQQASSQEE
jgi:hypothetical protein